MRRVTLRRCLCEMTALTLTSCILSRELMFTSKRPKDVDLIVVTDSEGA